MTANAWLVIAIISFSLAGLALIADIFIFVFMRINTVIGDLTGRTVAKEVKSMRASNAYSASASSGVSGEHKSAINYYENKDSKPGASNKKAVRLGGNDAVETASEKTATSKTGRRYKKTAVLNEETGKLDDTAAAFLETDAAGNQNLVEKYLETTVLEGEENVAADSTEKTTVLKEEPENQEIPAETKTSASEQTTVLEENDSGSTAVLENGTEVLSEEDSVNSATEIKDKAAEEKADLTGAETENTVISGGYEKTAVLADSETTVLADSGTTVLDDNQVEEKNAGKAEFKVTKHNMVTHTENTD